MSASNEAHCQRKVNPEPPWVHSALTQERQTSESLTVRKHFRETNMGDSADRDCIRRNVSSIPQGNSTTDFYDPSHHTNLVYQPD